MQGARDYRFHKSSPELNETVSHEPVEIHADDAKKETKMFQNYSLRQTLYEVPEPAAM